ncbi:hypothetical protein E1295_43420 [Nonomuraea mesophila]|uniref:Transcriptional regulator SbtR-like C-terminal domain-containing protein n=2 Tax=Nonomuraea mesophila TaxID=2530382 RepID=A0A4R5E813_9ACTN|nr:hypothetical protein [Nonomuraea mesophila]TDE27124.1 hypothetical protein E1295_43420 [Nonomuraea mesophila]
MGELRALLTAAQQAGEVRDDIEVPDVKALIAGCLARERGANDPSARRRMIEVRLRRTPRPPLSPSATTPLPPPSSRLHDRAPGGRPSRPHRTADPARVAAQVAARVAAQVKAGASMIAASAVHL